MADDPYDPTEPEAIRARIGDLKTKLAKRRGNKLFADNVVAVEAEITRLEGRLSDAEADPQPQ